MLALDVERVMAEVRAQRKARDERLDGIRILLEKYPGAYWTAGGIVGAGSIGSSGSFDSENAAFEYLSYTMSQLVWANPRWRVTTRRPRAQQMVAEAMQWMMNRWSNDSDLKTTLEDLAVDYSFAWAVAHVSAAPLPETYEAEDPILWPQLARVSPWDFGMDHRAPAARRARTQWHRYMIDKEDLVARGELDRAKPRDKREGWDLRAIRDLNETTWSDSDTRSRAWGSGLGSGYDEPDREQVEVVEVYFPGLQLPGKPGPADGFNGTIATYGVGQGSDTSGTVIRPPRPFFGPRWGPYTVIGSYIVPDSPFPLSLLAATAGHMEQASRVSQAVDRQVETYSRFGITSDAVLAKLIKDGKNDHVYTATHGNVEAIYREFERGGTTAANVAAEARATSKRDRAMGFAENQRGRTTGDTATDVTYANEASSARQGYVRSRFQDGIRRAAKTVAYYGYHTDEIITPLGPEAIEAFGLDDGEEAWFVGGHFDDGTGTTFDDLQLEIEPYSMERPSEASMRQKGELILMLSTQLVPQLPLMAQMGGDAKGILDATGEAFGLPELSRLFPGIESVDLASIQPAEAMPRMAKDVGALGLAKSYAPRGMVGQGAKAPAPQDFSAVG